MGSIYCMKSDPVIYSWSHYAYTRTWAMGTCTDNSVYVFLTKNTEQWATEI